MLSTFAGIGLKMLVPALNLRRNSKEYRPVHKLDEAASGCFSCPYYNIQQSKCESCEHKQYYSVTQTIYRNEKNRYGYRKPLKKYALLLYMELCFLNPDSNGLIRKIDPEELAANLFCSERTIVNNLHLLHDAGYILLNRHEIPGFYQAFLNKYKSTFLTADQGGRGYLRISREFMEQLTRLPDTNSLRLAIRSYIDNLEYGNRHQTQQEKSIREIKNSLPEYITKKKLFSILSDTLFTKMFHVTIGKRSAMIITLPEYDQQRIADLVRDECREKASLLLDDINRNAHAGRGKKNASPFRLTARELNDVANISLKIPIDSVMYGIRHFYEQYISRNISYQNAPSLIRIFASDHAQFGFASG